MKKRLAEKISWVMLLLMIWQGGVFAATGTTSLSVTVSDAPMPIVTGLGGLAAGGLVKVARLSWNQPNGDFDGFQVKWKKEGASVWNQTEVNSNSTTNVIITDLELGNYETEVSTLRDGSGGVAASITFEVKENEETGVEPGNFEALDSQTENGDVIWRGRLSADDSVTGAADLVAAISGSVATTDNQFRMEGGELVISSWVDSDRKVTMASGSTIQIMEGEWSGQINPPVKITDDSLGDFGLNFEPRATFVMGDPDAKLDFGSGTDLQPIIQVNVNGGCVNGDWQIARRSLGSDFGTGGIIFLDQEVSGDSCLVTFKTRYMSTFALGGDAIEETPLVSESVGPRISVDMDTGGGLPDNGHPNQQLNETGAEAISDEIAEGSETETEDKSASLVLDKVLKEGEETLVVSDKKARDQIAKEGVIINEQGEQVVNVISSRWVPSETGSVEVEGEEKKIALVVELQEGSVISSNFVFFGAVDPEARVVLALKMKNGEEKILGMAKSDDEGFYVFDDLDELPEGEFGIEVRTQGMKTEVTNLIVKDVDEIGFEPVVVSLGNEIVSSWAGKLMGNEIVINERYPLIRGRIDFANTRTSQDQLKGVALWKSTLMASTFLVNNDGTFVVTPPGALEDGDHRVTIFVTNEETKETVTTKIDFEVKVENGVKTGETKEAKDDKGMILEEKWMVEGETVVKGIIVLMLLGVAWMTGRKMRK